METRQRAIELRLKLQYAQTAVGNSLRFFNQSRQNFMTAIRTLRTTIGDLPKLAQQLEEDEKAVRENITQLHDLYNEMSNLDSQLLKEDGNEAGSLATDYVRSLWENGQIAASSVQTVRNPNYDDDDGSEREMHPRLEEYFSAIGDLRLMEERLVDELPFEHAEQRNRRNRMMDQDRAVSEAEEDFEEKCRQEIEEVHREIERLKSRVKQLLGEVTALGLDPDPTRYQRKTTSESSRGGTSHGVADWIDSVTIPAELSLGELEEVRSLAGSTHTSRPGTPTLHIQPVDNDEVQGVENYDTILSHLQPSDPAEVAVAQEDHLSQQITTVEHSDAGAGTHPELSLQPNDGERTAELQSVVLLSPEQSSCGSIARSDVATSSTDSHESRGSRGTDCDTYTTMPATLSSGSTKTRLFHRENATSNGQPNNDVAVKKNGELYGLDDDITLYTFSGMIMLQKQRHDFFLRGVVFEISFAEQPFPTQQLPAQAISGGQQSTVMVLKRNEKSCVACYISPRRPDKPSTKFDIDVVYVEEDRRTTSLSTTEHEANRNGQKTLRVRTWLPEKRTEGLMHMELSNAVTVSYDAKVRPVGSLDEKSLFDLIQLWDKVEKSMYSVRS